MFFDLFISVLFEIFQYFPYLYAPINMQNIIQSGKLLKGFGYIYTLELCAFWCLMGRQVSDIWSMEKYNCFENSKYASVIIWNHAY